jgi:hypothetical protein
MADVTPDGIVAFFPSYSYMTSIITKWHAVGILNEIQVRWASFVVAQAFPPPSWFHAPMVGLLGRPARGCLAPETQTGVH